MPSTFRTGMSLVELIVAMAILAMVFGALAAIGSGVHQGFEYTEGHGMATQHARVAIDRIVRTVQEANASEQFPGAIVVADQDGAWRFPETLVVWRPSATAADPAGLPRFNELVIYCPSAYIPNNILEITVPGDTRICPLPSNIAQWQAELDAIKRNRNAQSVTLTGLLRTCATTGSNLARWRGAVRFETRLLPSETQWAQYRGGTIAFTDLDWPQGLYGSQTGVRQIWVRFEMQLMPGAAWAAQDPLSQRAVPFFGSATIYDQLTR